MNRNPFNQEKHLLIPYVTFGDPSISDSEQLVEAAFANGADVVELGIPFSDPIADGPVIQASHFRALGGDKAPTIDAAFESCSRRLAKLGKPIVFMMSINLVLAYGIERFFAGASLAKVTGVVIPDLPIEDSGEIRRLANQYRVHVIFLVSPLASQSRLEKIVRATTGFLYVISTTGTTGVRSTMADNLEAFVRRIKSIRDVPVCVGFGISRPEHVKAISSYADGSIVGSHFVDCIHNNGTDAFGREVRRFSV